jgi:hypothetical protein
MPFKSKAQRRKFAQLLVEGKITDEQYEEWNRSTGSQALPERVAKKPVRKRAGTKRATKVAKRARKTAARKSSPRATSKAAGSGSARRKRTRSQR